MGVVAVARVRRGLRWRSVGAAATFLFAAAAGVAGNRLTGQITPALIIFAMLVLAGMVVSYVLDPQTGARDSVDTARRGPTNGTLMADTDQKLTAESSSHFQSAGRGEPPLVPARRSLPRDARASPNLNSTDGARVYRRRRIAVILGITLIAGVSFTIVAFSNNFIWHSQSGASIKSAPSSPARPEPAILAVTGYIPESVAFSPDGKTLAVATTVRGGGKGNTYLWNLSNSVISPFPDPGSQGVNAVAFSRDGSILAAGDADGSTYLWNLATHAVIAKLPDPGDQGVRAVAFSPDGSILAAGDADGSTYLWNLATYNTVATLPGPGDQSSGGVEAVAFSPDGTTLAVGDFNDRTYVWNTVTRAVTATLPGPGDQGIGGVEAVAFSPDGATLAVGDYNGSTYVWNVQNHAIVTTFDTPENNGVEAVAFSPDGATLAVGDSDGSAYLWDLHTRALIATLHRSEETHGVSSVAFSPNGETLATGDHAGGTFLWHITEPRPKARDKASQSGIAS